MTYEYPKYAAPPLGDLPEDQLRTEFRTELNSRFTQNQAAITNAQADNTKIFNDTIGCGRVMAGDSATLAPAAATGLTLHLPGGYTAIIGGAPFVAADPNDGASFDILTDIPPSAASYGYLGFDDDGLIAIVEWSLTPLPERIAAGFPCIGLVTATASDCTIDLNFETKVYPLSSLLTRIVALESNSGGGSSSGSGGGAGTASQLPFQTPGTDRDTRFTDVVVLEMKAQLMAYVDEQIATGGLPKMEQLPMDQIYQYIDGLARNVADVKPNSLRRMPLSLNRPGVWGNGENDGPVTDLGGTLPAVPKDREYNPAGVAESSSSTSGS